MEQEPQRRVYQPVEPISREEAEEIIAEDDPQTILRTLVRVAFFDSDYQWAQNLCIRLSHHWDGNIRAVSMTCIGHIARIHGRLDMDKVLPALERLRKDPQAAGHVEDAESDISIFIERPKSGYDRLKRFWQAIIKAVSR